MNLNDITTKPYILALFKRDDGTRFLLGSGAYEFKDNQQHFVANTMANDIVEVQGSDGALLAGQVRRSATQSFDGFIADGSSTKGNVENYRKAFIAFFQKNHYYTVVYIMADGTAIQRRRGYIVDAPEVRELYQVFPEYHVALNFEDVNYYKYAENADGDEIYSNLANLTSKITASGGLIWDSLGSATTTAEGTNFTIFGTTAEDNLESVQIKGQTEQASYTGKNLFNKDKELENKYINANGNWATGNYSYVNQEIATTGGEKITLSFSQQVGVGTIRFAQFKSDGTFIQRELFNTSPTTITLQANTAKVIWSVDNTNSLYFENLQIERSASATSYEPYVGGIASPNPDYPQTVQTVTGTQTITISDGGSQSQTLSVRLGSVELCKIGTYQDYIYKSNGNWYIHASIGKTTDSVGSNSKTISDMVADSTVYSYCGGSVSGTTITYAKALTVANTIYYQLATATDTQITDADLISDLDDLLGAGTYSPSTAFEITASNNLPAWLRVEAHSGSGGVMWDNIGATWEEGGEAGDTFITVDSITNVFPTITIVGPASNPQISNITTGQILNYTGNITSSQKLVIDIQQKTAKLNGTSVISNVSGDWLYLRPGNNRVVYTIENAEPNTATVEWQEITG